MLMNIGSSKPETNLIIAYISKIKINNSGGSKINKSEECKFIWRKITKYKNLIRRKNHIFSSKFKNMETSNRLCFYIAKVRSTFTKLRQEFITVPILYHFIQYDIYELKYTYLIIQ